MKFYWKLSEDFQNGRIQQVHGLLTQNKIVLSQIVLIPDIGHVTYDRTSERSLIFNEYPLQRVSEKQANYWYSYNRLSTV